jgi:DNA-binding response OmpR family regulator
MDNKSPLIFVVDDDATARLTVEALLETENYRLVFFQDGASLLERVHGIIPDLVLLDVMMPGMDGFMVCRTLRRDSRFDTIPIIMVTALDDQASRLKGFEVGIDHFISKPFNRHELRARIRAALRPRYAPAPPGADGKPKNL